jgi:hypothetical protein
MSPLF